MIKVFAYSWCDPILESPPDPTLWGWEIDRLYQDLGARSQLEQLFQDLQNDPNPTQTYLLIQRLEELGDSLETITTHLEDLKALNVRIITLQTDGDRPNILQFFHHLQTYYRSLRIRQGHARNRLQAKPPPGKAPYGYKRSKNAYILDRSCAPILKDFFEQFLLYGSVRGAVRYLNQKYRKKISVTTGRRWLTHPIYRGDTAFKNKEILSDTHPPILSREEAAQVDRLLRRNRRLPPRSASAPRSLAGLVTCQSCGSGMKICRVAPRRSPNSQRGEYLYLRPIHCPLNPACKSLRYEQVLQEAIQKICQDLPPAIAQLALPDLDQLKIEIKENIRDKQNILQTIPPAIDQGILDQETAAIRTYKLRTEVAQLQDRLAQLPPVNLASVAQAVCLPQFWLDLSESERRFYFREFIRQIQVIPLSQNEVSGLNWMLELHFIF